MESEQLRKNASIGVFAGANFASTLIALVAYSLYFLCRNSTPRVWGYIVATIVFTTLPIVAPDMLFAGDRTPSVRYFFPLCVGIDLSIVYLLYSKLRPGGSQADTWNKANERSIAIARAINDAHHPLLISDDYLVLPLGVGNYLKPNIRIAIRPRCSLCANAPERKIDVSAIERGATSDDVFVLGSSELLANVKEALGTAERSRVHFVDVCADCPTTQRLTQR